jgi:hypothetical protein
MTISLSIWKYLLEHTLSTDGSVLAIVNVKRPPYPSVSYSMTQICGTSDATQFPFPLQFYPDGHYEDASTDGVA